MSYVIFTTSYSQDTFTSRECFRDDSCGDNCSSERERYGKPDYQASATVISESHRVMAVTDEAQSDGGTLEDPEH